ncbi:hypothetical protein [Sporobacter termitidis]|uniref:hypothetical protein n=1 Tax=Sporobacter termitidis TaxID=44749 RepID=UPI0009341D0E|nr:hypothetical protein [Sporobacter termitidis]
MDIASALREIAVAIQKASSPLDGSNEVIKTAIIAFSSVISVILGASGTYVITRKTTRKAEIREACELLVKSYTKYRLKIIPTSLEDKVLLEDAYTKIVLCSKRLLTHAAADIVPLLSKDRDEVEDLALDQKMVKLMRKMKKYR